MSEKKLTGKVALITGASKGLGRAMALALGRQGCHLALVSRNEPLLQSVAKEARSLGAQAEVFKADLTREDEVKELEHRFADRFGKLQILINSAGLNLRKPITDFTLDEWNLVMDTNVTSVFLVCRAF